jgi:hypothetical protein
MKTGARQSGGEAPFARTCFGSGPSHIPADGKLSGIIEPVPLDDARKLRHLISSCDTDAQGNH